MQKITNQSHTRATFLYATSKAFERASYYGIRSIITLYMVKGILLLPEKEAFNIYSFFLTGLIFSQIIGALLGDLVLGNKKTMFIGGILQAIGAFALCIPSVTGLYTGMSLILIGSGLYSPNILSLFGKLYLNKTMLMDSGFSIYYIALNLGSFLGILIVVWIGDINYILGFITGGILMILSVIISFFIKEKKDIIETTSSKNNFNKRLLIISASILIVAVYWSVYDYSSNGFYYLDSLFAKSTIMPIPNIFSTFSSFFIIPIGIAVSIIWSFWYNSQLTKITIGFISGAIGLGVLLFLPENFDNGSFLLFILSMFLLNLAEFHLGPVLYVILTKNCNPKYLATIISLSFIPSKIFIYLTGSLLGNSDGGLFSIYLGAIILSLIAVALVILLVVKNQKSDSIPMTSKPQNLDL